jgi:hypothetical protein
MKKLFLLAFIVIAGSFTAKAQTDSTLQEYTGKFKFPDGSPFSEVTLSVENGVLTGGSSAGSSEFKKTETKDVFDIVAYGGVATFRRNADGKIIALRIQVNDLDIEGSKE